MLADRRAIRVGGKEVLKTPLLVPSFSSKGFPQIQTILEFSDEFLTDTLLVSAYDVHYKNVNVGEEIAFVPVMFLDSGGYESSKDVEFSDLGTVPHAPKEWTREMHKNVIDAWSSHAKTVVISYDHPKDRQPIGEQISSASALFEGRQVGRELLIKPETAAQQFVQIDSVIKNRYKFAEFDLIGFTEKELGHSVLERMISIARIRKALQEINVSIPIHIFGALDTITTPLYFLAGADVFDGLTWLRMAYKDGYTMYMHNAAIYEFGPNIQDKFLKARVISNNYYALQQLQLAMNRFLNAREFREFPHHSELLERVFQDLTAAIGGV